MLKIGRKSSISLTRGDSAYITLTIKDIDENKYVPGSTDVVKATVRKTIDAEDILFESEIPTDTMVWHILPADTKYADMEDDYVYDVQITTESGDVFTIIGPAEFNILGEVTYDYCNNGGRHYGR